MTLRKRVVAGTGLLLAAVVALIFATASFSPAVAGIALLVCAASFGMGYAVFSVGNADLLAKTVHSSLRGKVLAHRAMIGGLLTLAAVVAIWTLLPGVSGNHLIVLWLAVGAWLGTAAAYGAIQEAPSEPVPATVGMIDLRRGYALITGHRWFARLLTLQALLLSVELSTVFYAIHAASLHDPTATNLGAFVVAMSLGMVLAGPLWGRLLDRHRTLVTVICCAIAALCGMLVLVIDRLDDPNLLFHHAFLFLPLALAIEGVMGARGLQLSVKAPAKDRLAMFAVNNALLICMSAGVALALGLAGQLHDIQTPLVILIALNIAAACYAPRAFAD